MSKLGRNPLEKLQVARAEKEFALDEPALPVLEKKRVVAGPVTGLAKIKEMQIEVDWRELADATFGRGLQRISRFFAKF